VTIEPENGDFLDSLGWVYFKLNRLEEAEKRLRQAVEHSQENAVACDHLGDVLMALGHPQDALHMWQTALEQAKGLDQPERVRDKIEALRRHKPSTKS
jgi:tetratricopeptide (TPR) repeat protein